MHDPPSCKPTLAGRRVKAEGPSVPVTVTWTLWDQPGKPTTQPRFGHQSRRLRIPGLVGAGSPFVQLHRGTEPPSSALEPSHLHPSLEQEEEEEGGG